MPRRIRETRYRRGGTRHDAPAVCPRCGEEIVDFHDAVKARVGWIHRGCASGADDE